MNTDSHPSPTLIQRLLHWADQTKPGPAGWKQAPRTVIRVLLLTIHGFFRNELPLRAGALTYTILLSLVPILAISTSLVKGLGADDHLRQIVYEYLDTLDKAAVATTPRPQETESSTVTGNGEEQEASLTRHLRSAANRLFDYVDRTDFTALGAIGVFLMLITVIMVFGTIEKAMNTIWQVQLGRSTLRRITDYLALLILVPLAVNVGFAATAIIKNPAIIARIEPFLPGVETILLPVFLFLLPIFSITLALAITYMVFPNTRVRPIPAFTGALLAGSLWFAAQNLYVSLQIGVSKYNAIYGSFATLPLFLAWLYLGWIFILTGAQLACACQTRHRQQLFSTPATPAEQLSASFDIIHQVFLHFNRGQTLTGETLIKACPAYAPSLISTTLTRLMTGGLLHTNDQQQIYPSTASEENAQEAVIRVIVGTNTPDTFGGRQCQGILKATQVNQTDNP